MRVIRLVLTVAVILAIVGATDVASSSTNTQKTGSTLRKVGSILILAVLAVCTVFHFMLWGSKEYILAHRRTVSFFPHRTPSSEIDCICVSAPPWHFMCITLPVRARHILRPFCL